MEEYKYEEEFCKDCYGNPGNVRRVSEPHPLLIIFLILFYGGTEPVKKFKNDLFEALSQYGEYLNRVSC